MSEIILLNATVDAPVYNDFTVALLGLGIVFLGLISILLICKLFSLVLGSFVKNDAAHAAAAVHTAQTADTELSDEERGAVVAAVSAVIAEELGTDVSALRIRSFRKL